MAIQDVAEGLVSLCREGKFDEASETYYSNDIVSIEPQGDPREVRGMDAIRGKIEWWNTTFELKNPQVDGPWINEPYFAVKFVIDATVRKTGETTTMSEIAIYKVENDKIVEERFF